MIKRFILVLCILTSMMTAVSYAQVRQRIYFTDGTDCYVTSSKSVTQKKVEYIKYRTAGNATERMTPSDSVFAIVYYTNDGEIARVYENITHIRQAHIKGKSEFGYFKSFKELIEIGTLDLFYDTAIEPQSKYVGGSRYNLYIRPAHAEHAYYCGYYIKSTLVSKPIYGKWDDVEYDGSRYYGIISEPDMTGLTEAFSLFPEFMEIIKAKGFTMNKLQGIVMELNNLTDK